MLGREHRHARGGEAADECHRQVDLAEQEDQDDAGERDDDKRDQPPRAAKGRKEPGELNRLVVCRVPQRDA